MIHLIEHVRAFTIFTIAHNPPCLPYALFQPLSSWGKSVGSSFWTARKIPAKSHFCKRFVVFLNPRANRRNIVGCYMLPPLIVPTMQTSVHCEPQSLPSKLESTTYLLWLVEASLHTMVVQSVSNYPVTKKILNFTRQKNITFCLLLTDLLQCLIKHTCVP